VALGGSQPRRFERHPRHAAAETPPGGGRGFTGGMRRRSKPEPPATDGVRGQVRCGRETSRLLPRLHPGDIAVLDHVDLDSATAQALVAKGVAAVVNASPSTSGRYPNLGPAVLVEAGVLLVDDVGEDVFIDLRDGAQGRVDRGSLWVGADRRG
jgi:uncharacterized membrane-anchored protein